MEFGGRKWKREFHYDSKIKNEENIQKMNKILKKY